MAFRYANRHREDYFADGFTVLRGVIPASLLADLRRETDTAREIARRVGGPQCQRLQPVYAYPELNAQPFRDFLTLPEMRATVDGILGMNYAPSERMGVLLEPAEDAWCTNWHRDWGHHVVELKPERFLEACQNLQLFNQLNAALYDDHSLWVVPGSHHRADTDAERAAFPHLPTPPPLLPEMACTEYVRQMPGAIPLLLQAGDVAFYRACQWHIGTYVPYIKRATLHDGYYGPEDLAWQAEMRRIQKK